MGQSQGDALQVCSCSWKCLTGRDKRWYVCCSPVAPCFRLDKLLESTSAVKTPSFCRKMNICSHNADIHRSKHAQLYGCSTTFFFVLSHSYLSRVNSIWIYISPSYLHLRVFFTLSAPRSLTAALIRIESGVTAGPQWAAAWRRWGKVFHNHGQNIGTSDACTIS